MSFEPTSGDMSPVLSVTVLRRGSSAPVNLTNRTVFMRLQREGLDPINRDITDGLVDPASGMLSVTWEVDDLLCRPDNRKSKYEMQLVIDMGLPNQETTSTLSWVVSPTVG